MESIIYKVEGVCSREVSFCIEDGTIRNVSFKSGCDGNLQGISKLVEGMQVNEVIQRLKGISCEGKPTSCPDQLAKALEKYLKEQKIG